MSSAKLAVGCGLSAVALCACGTSVKPEAGSPSVTVKHVYAHAVDDPRRIHLQCLRDHGLKAVRVGQTGIQVGAAPGGPTITFTPTPGAAQALQMSNQVQGAEVIGSWLLYPNQAPDGELSKIEKCTAIDVKG